MKIVIVGFNVKGENSCYYRKLSYKDKDAYVKEEQQVAKAILAAYEKGADFCSVRFVQP